MGEHLLSGLRRPARRTARLHHFGSTDRGQRALPLLRARDTWHLGLVLLPLLAVALTAQTPGSAYDSIVLSGIRQGAYPGAVAVIGRHDRILYEQGFGHLTWSLKSPEDRPDSTLFDLASLTKAVGTTTATMILVDRGKINLDAPVATYLPEFNGAGTA